MLQVSSGDQADRLSILIRRERGCYDVSSTPSIRRRSFNPHPPRRRMLLADLADAGSPLDLSILIRHEDGCYDLTASNGDALSKLSILIRHEGGCYRSSWTVIIWRIGLSILIRHEGGCYVARVTGYDQYVAFQSSSATKADATRWIKRQSGGVWAFNPHPPRRRMLLGVAHAAQSDEWAFNPHPPRRRMLRYAMPAVHRNQGFQSSSATKADATGHEVRHLGDHDLSILIRHEGGCYLPHLAELILSEHLSILIRHEGGCYHLRRRRDQRRRVLSILIRHEGGCYVVGVGASPYDKAFQSSSATKADATSHVDPDPVDAPLSILIRHEGGCYSSVCVASLP